MFKQEIIDKKFSRAFHGYDIAEVDYFLDELYRELSFRDREEAALQAQIEEMRSELDSLRFSAIVEDSSEKTDKYEEESTELCFLEEHNTEDGFSEQNIEYRAETDNAGTELTKEVQP